jgi:hypothetical protein
MWTVSSPALHRSQSATSNVWLPHSDHPAGPILFPRRACSSVGRERAPLGSQILEPVHSRGMLGVPSFGRSEILLRWPNAMRSLRIVPLRATPEGRLRRTVSGWMMTGLSCHCSRQRENKIQNRRSQRRKAGATSSAAPVNTRNMDAETGCRERTIRSEAKCRYPPRRDTASWASRLPVAATRPRAPAEREDRKGAE